MIRRRLTQLQKRTRDGTETLGENSELPETGRELAERMLTGGAGRVRMLSIRLPGLRSARITIDQRPTAEGIEIKQTLVHTTTTDGENAKKQLERNAHDHVTIEWTGIQHEVHITRQGAYINDATTAAKTLARIIDSLTAWTSGGKGKKNDE